MGLNTLEKVRDCLLRGAPEITWQPEFAKAREVLQRSLLNERPAPVAVAALDGD